MSSVQIIVVYNNPGFQVIRDQMQVTSRWTKWDLQEDNLQTETHQDKGWLQVINES